MTAIEYLKTKARMTNKCGIECYDCPLSFSNNGIGESCRALERNYPEKAVEIVEKWAKEHPIKTRQSEFLKMFPNAKIGRDGCIEVCPMGLDQRTKCDGSMSCVKCLKNFWLEETK